VWSAAEQTARPCVKGQEHLRALAVKMRTSTLAAATAALALCLLAAAPAGAAASSSGLYVSGAGFGHGIGMSQYGAAGYALHGASYQQILADYYAQTTIGHVSPTEPLTVLLRASGPAVFTGADRIVGSRRRLDPGASYSVVAAGSRLRLLAPGGRAWGTYPAPLTVRGPGPLTLQGSGTYRGALVFRPAARGGVMSVNSVGLDDYVRGVLAAEMPPSWPAQALEAQAVASRTYAITQRPASPYFRLYDSTRSQVYRGVGAETPQSNAAVAATSGQVVEYLGVPVVTYFFASSGGETESVQNVFPVSPEAWLVARADPYDDSLGNPYYRWHMHFSLAAARARLGRLVRGSLLGIRVTRRGVSPRVVAAQVVGTGGQVGVSGTRLRQLLGTPSTWMSFTTFTVHGVRRSIAPAPGVPSPPTTTTGTTSGTTTTTATTTTTTTPTTGGGGLSSQRRARARRRVRYLVTGTVFPGRRGARVVVQRAGSAGTGARSRAGAGGWTPAGIGRLSAGGRYAVSVARPGRYRVLYAGVASAPVTVS